MTCAIVEEAKCHHLMWGWLQEVWRDAGALKTMGVVVEWGGCGEVEAVEAIKWGNSAKVFSWPGHAKFSSDKSSLMPPSSFKSLSLRWFLDFCRSSRVEEHSELSWTHCNAALSVTQQLKQYSVSSLGGHLITSEQTCVLDREGTISCTPQWTLFYSAAPPCSTGQRSQTDLQPLQEEWNKKKNRFASLLGKLFERLFIWSEAHSSHFSVCKTSKVTSYYLLPRLIVANEIPNALIEHVGNLLPNEVVFSHRQTKTKQQRGRYIKEPWSDGSHAVHWVSGPSRPFSGLYKTGRLLKYLTVRKETKTKSESGNNR